jgi:DNA gyrase inhibitor GyrI
MADLDVRIVTLPPLRVATFLGYGTNPEELAMTKLQTWAKQRGFLDNRTEHRIFGFDSPVATPGTPNRGYEFWIVVGDDVQSDGEATVKEFGGGLYAVTRCDVRNPWKDIPPTWQKLVAWCENSPYRMANHQWLEETFEPPAGSPDIQFVLDLHLPIAG